MTLPHRSMSLALVATVLACSQASPAVDAAAPVDAALAVDAGSDAASACADVTGAYVLGGGCTSTAVAPIPLVCVTAQTACHAEVQYAVFPPAEVSGSIRGASVSFAGCTLETGSVASLHCDVPGGATCDGSGTRVDVPGAGGYCCAAGSASACASGERCTIVSTDSANTQTLTACVAAGSLAEGARCTRTGGRVGQDDCGPGLFCANTRQPDLATRVCQRLCSSEADCASGERCLWLGSTPPAGVCTAACTIGGSDCPTGTTCRAGTSLIAGAPTPAQRYATFCHQAGAGLLAGACDDPTDCGPNLTCPLSGDSATVANTCRPTCDATHPCASGTCTAFAGVPNPAGDGFCAP